MTQSSFDARHRRIREHVIELCKDYPQVKGDYIKLLQYYHYYYDKIGEWLSPEMLAKMTNPESIGRAYRKAVELGDITLDAGLENARRVQEKNYREYYSSKLGRWMREDV